MTDLPSRMTAVPARLGTSASYDDRGLVIHLTPRPEVLVHGIIRASVVAYAIDCVAGITLDGDENTWTFTTDLSVRMQPVPAPARISAINTILRRGRRSATCMVEVVDDAGVEVAAGAIGFAHVPRQPDAPPKILVKPEDAPALFQGLDGLDAPLREAAGIVVLDAAAGVVEIDVIPEVCNPAGTLQGAMVALVAEAAAEELLTVEHGGPVIVTELDVRYLQQAGAGPVRSRCRLLGRGVGAAVQVELIDTATDRITTLVYVHAQPVG